MTRRKPASTVIIARGEDIVHFTVRPWTTAVIGAVFAVLAVGYLLATSYLALRDDLIAAAASRQARMQQAYEDRISALRGQVDRIASRQLLDQQVVESKVSELLKKQSQLVQRHGRLGDAIERAEKIEDGLNAGGAAAGSVDPAAPVPQPRPGRQAGAAAAAPAAGDSKYGSGKSAIALLWKTRNSFADGDGALGKADKLLLAVNTSLRRIEADQLDSVERLSHRARQKTAALKRALQAAGLKIAADYGKSDEGGPLIPARNPATFDAEVRRLDQALDQLDALKSQISRLPLANPDPGAAVTSGFGVRHDPMLGVPAFHPGLDLRAAIGTDVRVTADGTVIRAGWDGGYGRMVEVDHGNGYATVYGHLSKIDVNVGEKVRLGQVIGQTGSTGRSTGPHLHYEIRHDGQPVDPIDFLTVGRTINRLL